MVDRIGTEGLNQLARDARRAGADLPKALARINKRFVNERFVPTAKRNAASRANPRAGHKVVNSIRGLGSQTRAQIAGGSNAVPWFAGHNYGSNQLRRTAKGGHTTQFPQRAPKRGRGNVGYILEQAIDENMPGAVDAYGDMVLALMARREVS
jgi:hypothetical protein